MPTSTQTNPALTGLWGTSRTGTGTANPNATGNMTEELEALMPGFSKNLSTASGNINELLTGSPAPALARNAAAYYGVKAGVPGSEYVRNRGFDLYNTQANAMKQQGQDDLIKLLSTVSGTTVATPGQTLQEGQFTRNLGQQASQFGETMGFEQQQWQKQLELLDKYLGGTYGGSGGSPIDPGAFRDNSATGPYSTSQGNFQAALMGQNWVMNPLTGQWQMGGNPNANTWAPDPTGPGDTSGRGYQTTFKP